MKGLIFNGLERIITRCQGEDAWDHFLDEAGLEGAYTSLGNYDEAELIALVETAAHTAGDNISTYLRWIGQEMIPYFEGLYPGAFAQYPSTEKMLTALNDVIHPEVTKLYPGAVVPVFHYRDIRGGKIIMEYDSPRELCSLAHGLMLGTGDRFGEDMDVDHWECKHRGGNRCMFTVRIH